MLHRTVLTEEQIEYAMEHGEFAAEVICATPNVAVVLTQGWCPQWKSMDTWLDSSRREATDSGLELTVPSFVYDKSPLFKKFRSFKESHWNNRQVPYVRYYKNGKLAGESNYLPAREFFARFGTDGR